MQMELCFTLSELIALERGQLDIVHHIMITKSLLVLFVLNKWLCDYESGIILITFNKYLYVIIVF